MIHTADPTPPPRPRLVPVFEPYDETAEWEDYRTLLDDLGQDCPADTPVE